MKIETKDQILEYIENNHIKNEFEKWYRKYRLVISDLVLVRRLSTYIREEIEELKRKGVEICEQVKELIAESWIKILEKLEIDRYNVTRGELNGLNKDVLDILLIIFPYVRHYSRKPFTVTVTYRSRKKRIVDKIGRGFKVIKENITPSSVFICILFIVTLIGLTLLTLKNIEIRKHMSNVGHILNVTKISKKNITSVRNSSRTDNITMLAFLFRNSSILMSRQTL
ncbi:MAG: hypothetical protein GXO26_01715 [Crenarchaeota archaeon]|nr:hypothetical protein [Thermoproteota archaeon]